MPGLRCGNEGLPSRPNRRIPGGTILRIENPMAFAFCSPSLEILWPERAVRVRVPLPAPPIPKRGMGFRRSPTSGGARNAPSFDPARPVGFRLRWSRLGLGLDHQMFPFWLPGTIV